MIEPDLGDLDTGEAVGAGVALLFGSRVRMACPSAGAMVTMPVAEGDGTRPHVGALERGRPAAVSTISKQRSIGNLRHTHAARSAVVSDRSPAIAFPLFTNLRRDRVLTDTHPLFFTATVSSDVRRRLNRSRLGYTDFQAIPHPRFPGQLENAAVER